MSRILHSGAFRPAVLLPIFGIWMACLGFLTRGSRAGVVEDALDCLDSQSRSEAARDGWLSQADSLGRRIDEARSRGENPQKLLREADRIQRTAMDREVELMASRSRCRDLSARALPECEREITQIEARLAGGAGSAEEASRLIRLREARARMQASLNAPVVLGLPSVPPDSTDTQETLRGKLQYYHDVSAYLESLDRRVASRLAQVTQERRTLVEAQRFLQDLSFLDETGRISDGRVLPREGAQKPVLGADTGAGTGNDLDFVLGLTPVTPEDSDRLIQLLKGFRQEIKKELETAATETGNIERRVLPEPPSR